MRACSCERLKIQRVIIAPHSPSGADTLDLMRTFGAIGVQVSVIPALLQVVGSAVEFDDVQGVAMLGVRAFRLPRSSRLVKRAFDLFSAAPLLLIASPLLACIAVLDQAHLVRADPVPAGARRT